MEEFSKEVLESFKSDKEILDLQERIKIARKTRDDTKAKRAHEEGKLKEVEEEHKQKQKQLYLYKLTNELEVLNSDITKEQQLYDSCYAKRKHIQNESDRLDKSK